MSTTLTQALSFYKTVEDYEWVAMLLGIDLGRATTVKGIKAKIKEAVLEHPLYILEQLPAWDIALIELLCEEESISRPDYSMLILTGFATEFNVGKGNRIRLTDDVKAAFKPHVQEVISKMSTDNDFMMLKKTEMLLAGILNVYGVIDLDELDVVFRRTIPSISDTDVDFYGLADYLEYASGFFRFVMHDFGDVELYMSPLLSDFGSVLKERVNHPEIKDYRHFTFEDFMAAGAFPIISIPNKSAAAMKRYLMQYCHLDESDVENELMVLWLQTVPKEMPISGIVQDFIHEYNLSGKKLDKLLPVITNYLNDMPRWNFKGYSPTELSAPYRTPATPKVGRNDLCPCGSGKKYKHCCGAN